MTTDSLTSSVTCANAAESVRLTADEIERYAPYHTMAAFADG